jgi:hypothetical protein
LNDELFIKPWMVDMADDHYAIDITRHARCLVGSQSILCALSARREDPGSPQTRGAGVPGGVMLRPGVHEAPPSQAGNL